MLSPASRAERIRRCLVLARLDVEDVHRVVKPASVQQKDDVLAQIDAITKRANGDVAQKLDTRTDTASTARVRGAARLLGEESDCLLAWLVGSGFVQGRPYASDMLLSSVEVGVKEGIAIQRVMGSVDGILWAMSCADMMLSRALQLYHTRGAARPDAS
jgi:hypothetical protein